MNNYWLTVLQKLVLINQLLCSLQQRHWRSSGSELDCSSLLLINNLLI